MGKSASGKDTIYKKLLEYFPELKTVTLYTTRPMREGETEGVEYHFIGEEQLEAMKSEGRVIEMRTYQTMYGPWSYATVEDGQIDLAQGSYMMIGTLESYESIRTYFGENGAVPIYIEVEDGERLIRAVNREKQQKKPNIQSFAAVFWLTRQTFQKKSWRRPGLRQKNDMKIRSFQTA